MRWLRMLVEEELVLNSRGAFIELTEFGRNCLNRYLDAVQDLDATSGE
jgi:hypothetical protein